MNVYCTICSDLIGQADNVYFTKCGHVFHYLCLSQWIERSQSCPQCRQKVTQKCMFRVWFTCASRDSVQEDAVTLQSKLDDAQLQLRQHATIVREKDDKLTLMAADLQRVEDKLKARDKKLVSLESAIVALKEQLNYIKVQNLEVERLRADNEQLQQTLGTLNGLQRVLNATSDEVENMLKGYTHLTTLATFAVALKKALVETESKKKGIREKLQKMTMELTVEKSSHLESKAKIRHLEQQISTAKQTLKSINLKRGSNDTVEDDYKLQKSTKLQKITETENEMPQSAATDFIAPQGKSINTSMNSLVTAIEESESPYLRLRQSNFALSALQHSHCPSISAIKPSEFGILNPTKSIKAKNDGIKSTHDTRTNIRAEGKNEQSANKSFTIFQNKDSNKSIDLFEESPNPFKTKTPYDGLGGHSQPDLFPKQSSNGSQLSYRTPRLSAKHRLKKPSAQAFSSGLQDIGKFIQRLNNINS